MLSENMFHTDGVTTSEKERLMAKRKKKDAICAQIAYRVYGVLLEADAVQGKEMYDMFPHSQCRLRGCHEGRNRNEKNKRRKQEAAYRYRMP